MLDINFVEVVLNAIADRCPDEYGQFPDGVRCFGGRCGHAWRRMSTDGGSSEEGGRCRWTIVSS
jgi:hypothetical protein